MKKADGFLFAQYCKAQQFWKTFEEDERGDMIQTIIIAAIAIVIAGLILGYGKDMLSNIFAKVGLITNEFRTTT